MRKPQFERLTATVEGDFVLFLIGARINNWWNIRDNLWFRQILPRILTELRNQPQAKTGFLGHQRLGKLTFAQYWRSFDDLEAYARSPEGEHFPAWIEFHKRSKARQNSVGVWHETYLISAGSYETIYSGMGKFGLGKVGHLVPAEGTQKDARSRLAAGKAK